MHKLENNVIYQIYPKSYKDTTGSGIGDINGVIEKLDYLQELGVDYIWLSPCCKSPQNDNGYDIADYLTIDPMFGTNDDYQRFISEANQRGIKVMMDLVLNHTSNEHIWFKKALQGDQKYVDYYIWSDEPNDIGSYFEGVAWSYCEERKQYYFRLFDVSQPDLNWHNPEVRQEIFDIVNKWIERGVEGFRLDVIDLIGKEPENKITAKGPKFYQYLQELSANTFKDELLTVGECWGSSLDEQNKMCNPKALTQAFHFNHFGLNHSGDKWHRHELKVEDLAQLFNTWQNVYQGVEALVMNNHDAPRLISLWLNDKEYRVQSAKLLITLFSFLHGNLYIYQGEEIGMRNAYCTDLEKYRDVETINVYPRLIEEGYTHEQAMQKIMVTSRDNARIPMAWDNSLHGGFSQATPWINISEDYKTINAAADLASEDSIYHYYKELLAYRKEHYATLKQPATFSATGDVFEMKKGPYHLIANFSERSQVYNGQGKLLFTNYQDRSDALRAYEILVFEVK